MRIHVNERGVARVPSAGGSLVVLDMDALGRPLVTVQTMEDVGGDHEHEPVRAWERVAVPCGNQQRYLALPLAWTYCIFEVHLRGAIRPAFIDAMGVVLDDERFLGTLIAARCSQGWTFGGLRYVNNVAVSPA